MLFRDLPPDLRRRKICIALAAALTGVVIACIVAVVIYEVDQRRLF